MLSTVLEAVAAPIIESNNAFLFAERLADLGCTTLACKSTDFATPNEWQQAVGIIRELAAAEIAQARDDQKFFREAGIEKLALLIDNQPQLSITGSYRDVGRYGGPNEAAISVEFQTGIKNLNSMKDQCGSTSCTNEVIALETEGLDSTKIVLTASYRERKAFSLTDLGLDNPVDGFMPIDRGKSGEFKARLQGGLNLNADIAGRNTRLDVALDGIRISGDVPEEEKKNRWVGTATLTLPLGEKVSVPVTLTYANKPEFLGEQKEQFGVHFGLSWRLPFGPADSGGSL